MIACFLSALSLYSVSTALEPLPEDLASLIDITEGECFSRITYASDEKAEIVTDPRFPKPVLPPPIFEDNMPNVDIPPDRDEKMVIRPVPGTTQSVSWETVLCGSQLTLPVRDWLFDRLKAHGVNAERNRFKELYDAINRFQAQQGLGQGGINGDTLRALAADPKVR